MAMFFVAGLSTSSSLISTHMHSTSTISWTRPFQQRSSTTSTDCTRNTIHSWAGNSPSYDWQPPALPDLPFSRSSRGQSSSASSLQFAFSQWLLQVLKWHHLRTVQGAHLPSLRWEKKRGSEQRSILEGFRLFWGEHNMAVFSKDCLFKCNIGGNRKDVKTQYFKDQKDGTKLGGCVHGSYPQHSLGI